MHFLDELILTVRSGKGGDGKKSFLREKSRPWGGPDGGDGGRGGSVWFEADPNLNTFYPLKMRPRYEAQDGENGGSSNCTGRSGEDLVVFVPVGTVVREHGGSESLADLDAPGKRWQAAKGGRGGKGNQHFATPTNQAPQRADPGEPGETVALDLELKLLADVGLLGLPNAGKSTFLSRVSAAKPKIADYPFTTLVPNLGVVTGPDYRTLVIADIPGLIEGAHEGHGLGDQFLRHVERTRMMLHLADLSALAPEPAVVAVKTLERELRAYSPELAVRPRILVATKADLGVDEKALAALRRHAEKNGLRLFVVSAPTGEGMKPLTDLLWRAMDDVSVLRVEKPDRGSKARAPGPGKERKPVSGHRSTASRRPTRKPARKPAKKESPSRKKTTARPARDKGAPSRARRPGPRKRK